MKNAKTVTKTFQVEQALLNEAREKIGAKSQSETVRIALKRVIQK